MPNISKTHFDHQENFCMTRIDQPERQSTSSVHPGATLSRTATEPRPSLRSHFNKINQPLELNEATEIETAHVVHRADVDSLADITGQSEAHTFRQKPIGLREDRNIQTKTDVSTGSIKKRFDGVAEKEVRKIVNEKLDAIHNADHNFGKFKGPVQPSIELRSDLDMSNRKQDSTACISDYNRT